MADNVKQFFLKPLNILEKLIFGADDESVDVEEFGLRVRSSSVDSRRSRTFSTAAALYHEYRKRSANAGAKSKFALYNNSRRPRDFHSLVYREGPVSVKEIGRQRVEPLPGALDVDMLGLEDMSNDDSAGKTSSRSLLVYFARLAADTEEGETIDYHFVQSLLDNGASMTVSDVHGQTIMHAVVRDWNVDVARFIVERNADVNQADKYGRTPIHLAAACNHPDILKYLIIRSGDVDAETYGECQTPLHYAARHGSVACIEILITKGASINSKDFKARTPISLAAEMGQEKAARFLLSAGASSNDIDTSGNRTIAFMVEKMPSLAIEALDQLHVVDQSARRQRFYLYDLEYSSSISGVSKTVLQMVTRCGCREVITHPIIVKLLDAKWRYFGLTFMLAGLIVAVTLAGLFTSLIATIATQPILYTPIEDYIWRITVEILYVIFSVTVFVQHIVQLRTRAKNQKIWKEVRIADLRREKIYCHPRWPSDRKFLKHEIEATEAIKAGALSDAWDWFEIVAFLFNVLLVIMHAAVVASEEDEDRDQALHILYCLTSFIVWFRVLKALRGTRMMGDYIIMLGYVVSITIKFILLYVEILIPYVCSIWILFGGGGNANKIAKHRNDPASDTFEMFSSFNNLMFYSWLLSANSDIEIDNAFRLDEIAGKGIVAIYLGLTTILYLNLYVALVSHLYVRKYQTVRSKALLAQANLLDRQEQMLATSQRRSLKMNFTTKLNPLEETYFAKIQGANSAADANRQMKLVKKQLDETMRATHLKEISNRDTQADDKTTKISDLFSKLYHQQDRVNDKLDYIRDFMKEAQARDNLTNGGDNQSVIMRPTSRQTIR